MAAFRMPVLVAIIATLCLQLALTQASPLHLVDRIEISHEDNAGFENPCKPFGFDNRIVCLFCSVEDLMPFMHASTLDSLSIKQAASSSNCIRNFCEACSSADASCMTVNGKSLAVVCEVVSVVEGEYKSSS
jgi:hypothetical protein